MKLKLWIWVCLMLPLLAACSEEDDIDAIFMGRTWRLSTIMQGNTPLYEPDSEEQKEIVTSNKDSYIIVFTANTFSGKTLKEPFNGIWSVDAENRKIHFDFKDGEKPSETVSKKMIEILQNAVKYEGDTRRLEIHQKNGQHLLFYSLK